MPLDSFEFPKEFTQGLEALKARACPDAQVACVDNNFAWILLGKVDLEALELMYKEKECLLFIRVPTSFPNAVPYGIATVPVLHRRDDAAIERLHMNNQHTTTLAQKPGYADVAFWSWDTKDMKLVRPEQMAELYGWALKRLTQEK